ncbi:putative F-box domain-containing protein [Medicago truncatula]|uniref:Putative F-box domain-containing protein n=1 Tax=Medicago truncatula TaxID=3880 RepID=A0A072TQR9_MEDTR|nr:hypothetical protein MTR_0485s0020 [Medicago truncatula]RHN59968.1 putative F-box domain-containing protein [Medicago truncatula]
MEKGTVESPIMVLPKELMFEILFRDESSNPLELMRVSKLWKSLVLDPYFVEKHMKKSFIDIAFLFAKAMKPWNAFRSQHFIQKEEEVVDKEEGAIEEEKVEEEEERVVDEEKEAIEEEKTVDEEKEKFEKLAKGVVIVLNNDLATLSSIKGKMEALNVEMEVQPMEDRIKRLRSFVLVYIKSTTSSSSCSH